MIRKLRTRFIVLSMSTLLVVLVALVGGINLASYRSIVSEADRVLAAESPGRADKKTSVPEKEANGLFSRFALDNHSYTRLFSVILASDGTVMDVQLPMGSVIDSSEASDIAAKVFAKKH